VWNWSFGRQDTWRLGFYGSDVKFEVFPPSGCAHSTQMVYPLYAGRWYHLAPSMKTWSTRTNLSHFVNGQLLAWKNETSYTVKTGSAFLYLGWDQATAGATFKGIVDEFRLYKRALGQNSTRGLLWFTGGSNNLLIPRGVFYDSKLYQGLNGSFDSKSPLKDAVVNGNDNTLASNLNGRVIQLVITKNVTLADAWRILDLARTNKTGSVTAFAFFATSEFHTLGFPREVSKLVANTSVASSGNYTAPPIPPPRPWWDTVWNTIAGVFQYIWNAVVAVYTCFGSLAKWLADVFIGLTIGLATGNWNYFQKNVVEPLKKALEAFVNFIIDLVRQILSTLLKPILDWIRRFADTMILRSFPVLSRAWSQYKDTGSSSQSSAASFAQELVGPFLPAILVLQIVATILEIVLLPFMAIDFLMSAVAGLIIGFLVSQVLAILTIPSPTALLLGAIVTFAINLVDPPSPDSNPWTWIRLFLPWTIFFVVNLLSASRTQSLAFWGSLLLGGIALFIGATKLMVLGVGADQAQLNQYTRGLLVFGVLGVILAVLSLLDSIIEFGKEVRYDAKAKPPRGSFWRAVAIGIALMGIYFNWQYLQEHGG